MNKQIYLFVFFYLFLQVLAIIPEWNLAAAGKDLLESKDEYIYTINHRNLFSHNMELKKNITKTSTGEIIQTNYVTLDGTTKEVKFEQVESYYYLYNSQYIICPKGSFHPYDFTNESELKPDKNFAGENWDLRCYWHQEAQYLLVFYLMNGSNKNAYLTNSDHHIEWYDGITIKDRELFDYLLKSSGSDNIYQMMAILKNENNLELRYLTLTLQQGPEKQYATIQDNHQTIIATGAYTQAYFRNNSDADKFFYYFTYNDISDFKTGYSTSSINTESDYSSINNIQITNNIAPHLEFFNDMKIEEMNFLLYNKFLYYKMIDQKDEKIYHGIFDIKLNKIIFNTNEEITTFIPFSDSAMLAITKTTAYKICAYNNNNDCAYTCTSYLLDVNGNSCGTSCPNGEYLFSPSGVCINQCDSNIYVSTGTICQLCKDKDSSTPYKLINGTDCLSSIPDGAEYYNENLKLLKCKEGYHLENNQCLQDCYELCKTCSEKSTDEENQKCTGCISGFVLNKTTGNCQCERGNEKKEKTCIKCGNSCGSFQLNSCKCESCNIGYYLTKDFKCEECKSPCLTCEDEASKCTSCDEKHFLDNNHCNDCPAKCGNFIENSCKCESCDEGEYLDSFYCKNCSQNCKSCNNGEQCNECYKGFYKENNACSQCSEICETCNGGIEDEKFNHHCLTCDNNTEYRYLINENEKHICVNSCEIYNMTFNKEKNICESDNKKKGGDDGKGDKDVDYMLWIFVAIMGVLLIIITICICKRICFQKNDLESINEIEGELLEK